MRDVDALRRQAEAASDASAATPRRCSTGRCRGRGCGASTRCSASCGATAPRARHRGLHNRLQRRHARRQTPQTHARAGITAPPWSHARTRDPARALSPTRDAIQIARSLPRPLKRGGVPMTAAGESSRPDLKTVLRRLKLSRMLDALPERLTLARQRKDAHQNLLLQVLSDEVSRRESLAVTLRVQKVPLRSHDALGTLGYDREGHFRPRAPRRLAHAALPRRPRARDHRRPGRRRQDLSGPRPRPRRLPARRYRARRPRRTEMLKDLLSAPRASITAMKQKSRNSSWSTLILDDFAIDVVDPVESRDLCRPTPPRAPSRWLGGIITSNRGPDEWLATFADPVRAQSAIDRFTSNAYDPSSTANRIGLGSSHAWRRTPKSARDDRAAGRAHEGALGGSHRDRRCRSRRPPSARRLSDDQSGGESVDRNPLFASP